MPCGCPCPTGKGQLTFQHINPPLVFRYLTQSTLQRPGCRIVGCSAIKTIRRRVYQRFTAADQIRRQLTGRR